MGKIWLNIGICQTLGFSILKMSPQYGTSGSHNKCCREAGAHSSEAGAVAQCSSGPEFDEQQSTGSGNFLNGQTRRFLLFLFTFMVKKNCPFP
jgi:hypothetical protein